MTKLVKLELTDTDCLSLRLALNAAAMQWGDKASTARKAGDGVDAATCELIRSDYHRLWELVNAAQEADFDREGFREGLKAEHELGERRHFRG
jgi:hypothetical protein